MTDWFARPVLHVTDVEASLRFYVNRLGFTNPWRYDEDGRAYVAQVDRQGCSLILADTWPEKIGKGLMFISLNVEPQSREAAVARWTHCARNSRPRAFRSRRVRGATGSWWSMISTAISSSSTIRARLRPARLLEMKHNRAAAPAWLFHGIHSPGRAATAAE
jgi:catechol 2,3-dioxygenase-like lactoylglutathione lyase family enzyme